MTPTFHKVFSYILFSVGAKGMTEFLNERSSVANSFVKKMLDVEYQGWRFKRVGAAGRMRAAWRTSGSASGWRRCTAAGRAAAAAATRAAARAPQRARPGARRTSTTR